MSLMTISAVSAEDNISQSQGDILKTPHQTFTDLNNTINGNDDEDVYLSDDIVFDNESDSDLRNGIVITRNVTVNGNGHTIDANNHTKIFKVTSNVVSLR